MAQPIRLTGHAGTIYAHLRDHGPNYGMALSRKLGISSGGCSVILRQLESRGLLASKTRPSEDSSVRAPRVYFCVVNPAADVIAEPATGPSPKARKSNKGRRVTLKGLSEHYDADEVEALVRAAAEFIGGGEDRDSLSERQVELAEDAYRRLMAEFVDSIDGPDVNGSEHDQDFYAALRDHAHDHGVQVTWTAVYERFRNGALAMSEEKLLVHLGTLLSGQRAYDPVTGPNAGWSIVTSRIGELARGELFSADGGDTWHACERQWGQVVSCYRGKGRRKDTQLYQVEANFHECLVVRRT